MNPIPACGRVANMFAPIPAPGDLVVIARGACGIPPVGTFGVVIALVDSDPEAAADARSTLFVRFEGSPEDPAPGYTVDASRLCVLPTA